MNECNPLQRYYLCQEKKKLTCDLLCLIVL